MSRLRTSIPEGTRFGNWIVTGPVFVERIEGRQQKTKVPVRCDCGRLKSVSACALLDGRTLGCFNCRSICLNGGCYRKGPDNPNYLGPGNTKRDIKRAWLIKEKSRPCVDCGRSFPPYCMELDHVPERGKKQFMVNLKSCQGQYTLEELKTERQKCDLVCAVCHNHRTWERANNLSHTPLPACCFRILDGVVDAGVLADDNDRVVRGTELVPGDRVIPLGQMVIELEEAGDECAGTC
jgi:hypothetical protein